jgi:hypothetical protein
MKIKRNSSDRIVNTSDSSDKRALLKQLLEKESKLTAADSLLVLQEFEELEDNI